MLYYDDISMLKEGLRVSNTIYIHAGLVAVIENSISSYW